MKEDTKQNSSEEKSEQAQTITPRPQWTLKEIKLLCNRIVEIEKENGTTNNGINSSDKSFPWDVVTKDVNTISPFPREEKLVKIKWKGLRYAALHDKSRIRPEVLTEVLKALNGINNAREEITSDKNSVKNTLDLTKDHTRTRPRNILPKREPITPSENDIKGPDRGRPPKHFQRHPKILQKKSKPRKRSNTGDVDSDPSWRPNQQQYDKQESIISPAKSLKTNVVEIPEESIIPPAKCSKTNLLEIEQEKLFIEKEKIVIMRESLEIKKEMLEVHKEIRDCVKDMSKYMKILARMTTV